MDDLIRFGTHAEIIRRNGFPWIIPASGKNPAILRYPEYEWPGLCSPLSHRLEQMPGVRAAQVVVFREQALKIIGESGYIRPQPQRASFGPSHSVAGIGDMMSEILREIGVANADPLVVAASYFERAPDGAKHYAMVAAVSALVLRGYSDQEIVEALVDAYQCRVHDDPGLQNLLVCPKRVRRGMLRRGAVLPDRPVPRTELDSDQHVALNRLRRRLHDIFDEDHDPDEAAKQVERLVVRVRDPQVRAALAPSIVRFLAIDGWDDQVISNAIGFVQGRTDAGLARWAQRFRERSAS
jgi:hypothetical protein